MATPPLHPKDPNASPCDKISSNCIIWQGRDIPCIDLCTGDTIDEVVNKLAVILCEIADLVNLDVSCLLASGEVAPKTITEFAELIIESICDLKGTTVTFRNQIDLLIASIPNPDNPLDPIYPLPPGLYFYDSKGDLITQLPLSDYVYYLATKIVDIIAFNDYYKQQQEIINTKFDNLALRVSTLETTAAAPPVLYVISQGASHYIPGTTLPIEEGFWNFERNYVAFSNTVGSTTDLTTAMTKQTPNLANLPQLSNPTLFMKNIAGWIITPQNLAHSFNNLWLTVTDLRARVQADINAIPAVPCIPVPVENLKITAATSYYATIEFTPSTLDIQPPIGYLVEVFDPLDTTFASPVYSSTVARSPINISSTGLGANQEYVVSVITMYDCGNSVRMTTTGVLFVPVITFQIKLDEFVHIVNSGLDCKGLGTAAITYNQEISTARVTLINKVTGADVSNTGSTPITVVLKIKHSYCGGVSFEDITAVIPSGGGIIGDIDFTSYSMSPCSNGICGEILTSVECGVSISNTNTEFDGTTIEPCLTP